MLFPVTMGADPQNEAAFKNALSALTEIAVCTPVDSILTILMHTLLIEGRVPRNADKV